MVVHLTWCDALLCTGRGKRVGSVLTVGFSTPYIRRLRLDFTLITLDALCSMCFFSIRRSILIYASDVNFKPQPTPSRVYVGPLQPPGDNLKPHIVIYWLWAVFVEFGLLEGSHFF